MEHLPAGNALWDAAQAVNIDSPAPKDVDVFLANVIARKRDHLPEDNKDSLMSLVFSAGARISSYQLDPYVLEFLDSQLGRTGVEKLIAAQEGEWTARDCSCGDAPGYHVFSLDRFRSEAKKADNLIVAIFGSLDDLPQDLTVGRARHRAIRHINRH